MSLYAYADLTLLSEIQLDTLAAQQNASGESSPDFIIRLLKSPPAEPPATTWLQHWQNDAGELTLSLAVERNGYLLRFPSLVDFVISKDCSRIGAWPILETDCVTLQHLLLDQVLPRLLGERGLLVLHASAVSSDTGVIAFTGQTGHGKSTLAASLHAVGLTPICDDGLVVTSDDHCSMALPIYPGLRLWPESMAAVCPYAPPVEPIASYSSKHRIVMKEQSAPEPLVLTAIYVLAPPPPKGGIHIISIDRISSRDACIMLMRNSFRLHLNHPRQASALLARASETVSQVPVFALNYPREYSQLADVHAAIKQHSQKQTESIQTG
jgi:hypothetical protein